MSPPDPRPGSSPGPQPGAGASPLLLQTKAALAAARPALGAPVVLVPTMGALHSGHRALLAAARELAGPDGSVIVSVFVNPLQFRPGEDLDRYPRTLDDDVAMCASEGVQAVFAPSAAEMYPGGQPDVRVSSGPVSSTAC
jgi:pantoate--beta-alanine ligase